MPFLLLMFGLPSFASAQNAAAFDVTHDAWTRLLKQHVKLIDGGKTSRVDYAGLAADASALKAYTASLSAVSPAAFAAFDKPQRMAFLINAYNAFTVELVLTAYPKLNSIKDLGSLFQSPWKKSFVPLLGKTMSLDEIEHDNLRARGRYDDPRIHFAVNCASIGCPMLREEAYVASRLDSQLDEQVRRFLSDASRNRYDPSIDKLRVSKIFDWYGDDFRQGHRGIVSLPAFFAAHADDLADKPAGRQRVRSQQVPVEFMDYDWALNDSH
ncbi:MAG: DUF547 domain-containing protein [Pseudomonadota bacterium]|nr:DUF547 domain-containing protein [Pseudomonadota bacterium]